MRAARPVTTRFQQLAALPTMQLFASTFCNLKCPYCSQGNARKSEYTEDLLNTPLVLNKIAEWPDTHFYISGGEPLIHHGIKNFLRATENLGHMISFDTNGVISESNLKRIVDLLPPERFGLFNISHHILAGVSMKVVQRTCRVLQQASIPHFVKYVGTPEMLPTIAQNMQILRDQGTGVAVTILETYHIPWNGRNFPKGYTIKELVQLLNMVTLGTHAMQCFGGIQSNGRPCLAGSTYVAYNMKNQNELTACCHRRDDIAWEGTVFGGAPRKAKPCLAPKCLGDLMFILGLQGGPDEMARFEQVCLGNAPALGLQTSLAHVQQLADAGMRFMDHDRFLQLHAAVLSTAQAVSPTQAPAGDSAAVRVQTSPPPQRRTPLQSKAKLTSYYGLVRKLMQPEANATEKFTQQMQRHPYYYDLDRWPGIPAQANMAKHQAARTLGFPLKFNVEVTTQCIFKCEFCVLHSGRLAKKRAKLFMSYEDFVTLFLQIQPFATHIEFTGGEPLLNKHLYRMIELCNKAHVKTTLATNAKLLTARNMQALLDAPPSILLIPYESGQVEAYEHHRIGGNLGVLEHNIQSFIQARDARGQRYPRVQLQTVVSRETAPHMESFWRDAQLLNVDEACSKPIFVWPDGDAAYWELMKSKYLIPDHPLSYYQTGEDGQLKETGVPSHCPNLTNVHIGTDGTLIHCWYNLLASKPMGNALETPFLDIWFSEESAMLREAMRNHTAYEHGCRFCIGVHKPHLFQRNIYRAVETC